MAKKRKVFLYKIHHRDDDGYGDDAFEVILSDIMKLDASERSWHHRVDDDEAFMRLLQFEKLHPDSQASQCYAGIMAMYGSNVITTGRDDDDSVRRYPLPDGRLPLQVVHFLYYADKRIMALEYNRSAATNVKLIAYVNQLIMKLHLSHKLAFIAEVICHPSAVDYIRQAHRIKSTQIVVPREAITSNNHLAQLVKDLYSAPMIDNHLDTLGSVVIEFRPRKGEFLSPGRDIDAYLREFPDVEKQVYKIEAEEGMEITSVNLLQPQFKNDIDLPSDELDQAAYATKVFDAIHEVYRLAGEVIDAS